MVTYTVLPLKCPACGEFCSYDIQEVHADTGYSMKKGVIGTLLLGPVGAVAGINGKKEYDYIYTCKKCGHKFIFHKTQ